MAIVWKVVKPKTLNEDALRLFMLNAMRRFGTEIKREYAKTTKTWKHKPKFETSISLKGSRFTVETATKDKIFGYVDRGTGLAAGHRSDRYPITPHPPRKALRWNSKFTAKTKVGVIGSRAGFSGPPPVLAKRVMHPGVKPRKFTEIIEKSFQKKFITYCNAEMAKFAKGSGHYAGRNYGR